MKEISILAFIRRQRSAVESGLVLRKKCNTSQNYISSPRAYFAFLYFFFEKRRP